MRSYEVQAGDTLERLAARELGHRLRWISLFTWNAARVGRGITSRDLLKAGLVLYLPNA